MTTRGRIRAIERELAEQFSTLCLDNRPERMKLARLIAHREDAAALAALAPFRAKTVANETTERDPATALAIAEQPAAPFGVRLHKIPVYDVRLVQSRRPLMLAETSVTNSVASARALHALIGMADREQLVALFVNNVHQIMGAHIAATGGQDRIGTIDCRTILRAGFAACAAAIVLGHNHPSGDPTPSAEDFTATANFRRAGAVVSMPVLDHVIVTRDRNRYYSMLVQDTLPSAAAT